MFKRKKNTFLEIFQIKYIIKNLKDLEQNLKIIQVKSIRTE